MAELIAKSPLEGQAAVARAGLRLEALPSQPMWSIAPYPGADLTPLLAPLGLGFPGPGQVVAADNLTLFWTGRDQAFLLGGPPPEGLADLAAVTDQSGAWAGFTLTGAAPDLALARLVTPDLRLAAWPMGRVLRTGLNHMPAILWHSRADQITLFTFRSMARTAWHEICEVLERLEAREAAVRR